MTASRIGLTPLIVLRIDGPLTTTTLANLIDEPWVPVMEHCQELEDVGLIRSLPNQQWDVTPEGRLAFKAQLKAMGFSTNACVGGAA
jgi:hypothetical protein